MAIRKIEHIGVFVEDMDVSVKFYCDVLGLHVTRKVPLGDKELVFVAFQDTPDVEIELVPKKSPELAEVGLVNHIAFTVDDIESVVSQLRQAGVEFMDEHPNTLGDGTKYIFFYGPDREHLELFQRGAR